MEFLMINTVFIASCILSLVVTALIVKYLPKLLALARLDKQVHDNTLAIVNGLLIAFVLIQLIIRPISFFMGGGRFPF